MHTQLPPNRLRELRDQRDLSITVVAAKCDVYPTTVARWEKSTIPHDKVPVLAELLKTDAAYLVGYTDAPAQEAA